MTLIKGKTVMFLKKVDGPRQVTLPDGSILTRADLPPADTRRWVASRKVVVVRAVSHGLISEAEALERYGLSAENSNCGAKGCAAWRKRIACNGNSKIPSKMSVSRNVPIW